jgi:hypothetical protein
MDAAEASQAIFQRWITMWPALSGSVPYSTDGNVASEGAGYFARVAIVTDDTEQATLGRVGSRRWSHDGLLEVRLSGPLGEGRGPVDALAELVREIYQGKRFGKTARERGIVTHAMSTAPVRGGAQAKTRWTLLCTIPFDYFERS